MRGGYAGTCELALGLAGAACRLKHQGPTSHEVGMRKPLHIPFNDTAIAPPNRLSVYLPSTFGRITCVVTQSNRLLAQLCFLR